MTSVTQRYWRTVTAGIAEDGSYTPEPADFQPQQGIQSEETGSAVPKLCYLFSDSYGAGLQIRQLAVAGSGSFVRRVTNSSAAVG